MKYLFAPNTVSASSEVYALKDFFDKEEIACFIRNEHLSIASGELAPQECFPALWVSKNSFYWRLERGMRLSADLMFFLAMYIQIV
jgi:hypothetical protein